MHPNTYQSNNKDMCAFQASFIQYIVHSGLNHFMDAPHCQNGQKNAHKSAAQTYHTEQIKSDISGVLCLFAFAIYFICQKLQVVYLPRWRQLSP